MSGAFRELVISTQKPNVISAITFPGCALGPPAALRAFSRSAMGSGGLRKQKSCGSCVGPVVVTVGTSAKECAVIHVA